MAKRREASANEPKRTRPEKFNPLALNTLAETMVSELLKQKPLRMDSLTPFEGPGVYAIYYTGSLELYEPVSRANRGSKWQWPIYVGKAQFDRLRNHAESIRAVKGLHIDDFWCRHLVTEEIFIPLCEDLLNKRYEPIWNTVIKGFGPKVVGKTRTSQQTSMWDILHPGRSGRGASPNMRFESVNDIKKKVGEYYDRKRVEEFYKPFFS